MIAGHFKTCNRNLLQSIQLLEVGKNSLLMVEREKNIFSIEEMEAFLHEN